MFASRVIAILLLLTPSLASATTLRRASLDELVNVSSVVVHAVVRFVEPDTQPFNTAYDLELLENIKGLPSTQRTFRFVLPGGRTGDRELVISGMPRFKVGDEVVLILERTARGELTVAGFSQGAFKIQRRDGRALAMRSLDALLLDGHHQPAAMAPAPQTLPGLLAELRELVARGRP